MAVTMSTLSAILKEVYEAPLRRQINDETVAAKRLVRSSDGITNEVGGKYVTFPISYGRNGGIGARAEMADLPKAGHQATAAARIKLKHLYGSIALSGQTLKLADSNYQSFISALELETQGLKTDLAKDINQQIYRDGTGNFAEASAISSATATISSGFNVFSIGMVVDTFTSTANVASGTTSKTGLTVTGLDKANSKVTFDANLGASDKYFTRSGSANEEWTGLGAIVKDSDELYNVDPSTVDQWRAVVDSNSGTNRALTEGRIIKNVDEVRTNGGKVSLILTTLGVRRSYFGLLVQQREFVNTSRENKSFEGGFTGLAFTTDQGEIPIVSDVDCPSNTMYGLAEPHLKIYRESDWSFMSQDGNMWVRIPGDAAGTWKDGYAATMFQYSQLGTDRRNVHFKIADLTES